MVGLVYGKCPMNCGTTTYSETNLQLYSNSSYYDDYTMNGVSVEFTLQYENSSFIIDFNNTKVLFNENRTINYWNGSEYLDTGFDWMNDVKYKIVYNYSLNDLTGIYLSIENQFTRQYNISVINITQDWCAGTVHTAILNFLNLTASQPVFVHNISYGYIYLPTVDLCLPPIPPKDNGGDEGIFGGGTGGGTYSFTYFSDGSAILVNALDGATTQTVFNISYIPLLINEPQNSSLFILDQFNISNTTSVINNRINYFNVSLPNSVYNLSVHCFDTLGTEYNSTTTELIVDNVAPNVTNITSDATSYLDSQNAIISMNCTDDNIRSVYFEYYIDGVYQSTYPMSHFSGDEYRASLPLSTGAYNISNGYCADYSTITASNNSVQFTVTHKSDSGGGGGGGTTVTFLGFGNFSIYPSQNITYTAVKGFTTTDEFRIVNEDIKDISVKVVFNRLKSTPAIEGWFSFLNTDKLDLNFTIESTEGLTNPFVYVRYQIEIPDNVVLDNRQNYVVVLDVISAKKSTPVTITLKQSDSFFVKVLRFLSQELYTFSESFNTVTLNDTTNQETTTPRTVEFSIRMWHVLLLAVFVLAVLIIRKRRRK